MGLSSFLSRRDGALPQSGARNPSADGGDSVRQARVRARHRVIGSAVLVAIGIVVFPLLFETEPRPVSTDIPIEIARRSASEAAARSAARDADGGTERAGTGSHGAPAAAKAPAPISEPVAPARGDVITETAADAGREIAAPASRTGARADAAVEPAAAKPPQPARTPAQTEVRVAAKPAPTPTTAPAPPSEAARAQLLLEGREAKPEAEATRYIVQVGAFADAAAARETRSRVERLGLKTYTQVAQTSAGERTRVRVGPVATRDEADRMQARLKAAGIPAVVLSL